MTERDLSEIWNQFTVFPPGALNRLQPKQVLITFLPRWLAGNPSIARWHILFEPSALIRFQAPNSGRVLASARAVAKACGLDIHEGDISPPESRNRDEGPLYYGEADIYGDELWSAMTAYLEAVGRVSIELNKKEGREFNKPVRQMLHLLLNPIGLNFLEEASIYREAADYAMTNYEKFGRN